MMTNKTLTLSVILLVLGLAFPAFAGEPTVYLKERTARITKVLAQKASKERKTTLQKLMNETMNFRELAARSLGNHWTARTPEEQEEFLSLLRELLQVNYEKKLTGQIVGKDYTITYGKERVRKEKAIVKSSVKYKGESKPVDYKLISNEGKWSIYDLVIDDISLEETYREAYVEIIEDEGWNALIQRMKDKLKEAKAN